MIGYITYTGYKIINTSWNQKYDREQDSIELRSSIFSKEPNESRRNERYAHWFMVHIYICTLILNDGATQTCEWKVL